MPSLTRAESQERAHAIRVTEMRVELDLDQGPTHFASRTEIHFEASAESTFVDLAATTVHAITLGGVPLDPASVRERRLTLTGLGPSNVLVVDTTMAFSRDGQGLHRSVDPADGEAYVYGHVFLDAAPTVFACFDQPDLKAPYAVSVRTPHHWRVLGNGHATQTAPGQWELARTAPLATYFVTVCAGPWASAEREHRGLPLGIHARRSLADPLARQADQLLDVTAAFMDYFQELFGIGYPFGDYHQVFCPEFNAGAMENPGCVTIRDNYLFRGAATDDELLTRTNTIAHEMAHMWFGDLVTMKWWDDLWLNESFAEYLAHRACSTVMNSDATWIDSTMARALWGHSAERSPSTHPVAGSPAPDAQSALNNFDGISYAKGAAVLRQLIAHIGDAAFVAGVRDHLRANAFGNSDLAGFLASVERAADTDLSGWSNAWLETAGMDTVHAHQDTGRVTRTIPADHPKVSRPHTFDIAGFDADREVFRVRGTVAKATTRWPALQEAPRAAMVIPNASDLTWAVTGFEPETLANLPLGLASIPDTHARAVAWLALIDGMHLGTIDPRTILDTFSHAWPVEVNDSIRNRVGTHVVDRVIPNFVVPQDQRAAESAVADAAQRLIDGADSRGGRLIGARVVAQTTADVALLGSWLAGTGLPPGLADDSDFRWLVVRALARLDAIDDDDIDMLRAQDATLTGDHAALAARATRPSAATKRWAWAELTATGERSNYERNALAGAFWVGDRDLLRPYVERYFADIPALGAHLGEDALGMVATLAYPLRVVEPATLEMSQHALADDRLSPALRRAIVDAQAKLDAALTSQARFASP